jgi:predicted nucleic acid-binding protein
VSTPDPALLDTDVASVLYRARLFQRMAPARLVGVVADRPLAISVITLGEASYGALSRKWSVRRTAEMLAFYTDTYLARSAAVVTAVDSAGHRGFHDGDGQRFRWPSVCGGGETRTLARLLKGCLVAATLAA